MLKFKSKFRRQRVKETFRCVRPERVDKLPTSMIAGDDDDDDDDNDDDDDDDNDDDDNAKLFCVLLTAFLMRAGLFGAWCTVVVKAVLY